MEAEVPGWRSWGKSEKASWDAHAGAGRQNETWWGRMFQAEETVHTKALWETASWHFRNKTHFGSRTRVQKHLWATLNSGAVTTSGRTTENSEEQRGRWEQRCGEMCGTPPAEEPRSKSWDQLARQGDDTKGKGKEKREWWKLRLENIQEANGVDRVKWCYDKDAKNLVDLATKKRTVTFWRIIFKVC